MAFSSLHNWQRVMHGVEPAFRLRALLCWLGIVVLSPLRWTDTALYGERVRQTTITQPPVFIIGHWRSGTTYLFQLMTQAPDFGYITLAQALAPDSFMSGHWLIKPLAGAMMPPHRPGDSIQLKLHLPEEDEYALTNTSPHGLYHHWAFPRRMREHFDRYALFKTITPAELDEWRQVYTLILKKATYYNDGKRLLLKNPANTGRIPALLSMFPEARFIHIYRNPYDVYFSSLKFNREVMQLSQFQHISDEALQGHILAFYRDLMRKFIADQAHIPAGQLLEIRFESLLAEPLDTMRTIYEWLALDHFQGTHFTPYILEKAMYQQNKHPYDLATMQRIHQEWNFAFERWGYDK